MTCSSGIRIDGGEEKRESMYEQSQTKQTPTISPSRLLWDLEAHT